MRLLTCCAMLFTITTASGCNIMLNAVQGSGVMVTDVREVPEFTKIKLTSSADVIVTIGDVQTLEVDADDNLIDMLTTTVDDGRLNVTTDGSYSTRVGMTVRVTVKSLEGVSISGSGDITVNGLAADEFSAQVTGSGDVLVTGTANAVTAKVTGSGTVDLSGVPAETAKATVTGSGDVYVHAAKKIDARITGSGDITYSSPSGAKPEISDSVTGSGDISRR